MDRIVKGGRVHDNRNPVEGKKQYHLNSIEFTIRWHLDTFKQIFGHGDSLNKL